MAPIRFAFGLHLHQPVGNFDHVFAQHVDDVYRPLLDALADREFLPVVLHLCGPLLEWLEAHESAYLDRLGRLAADGRIEILLAGFYEPVLASLPREDRVEQIRWMHDAVRRRFGVDARGLWLTERVWEPELAADLADGRRAVRAGGRSPLPGHGLHGRAACTRRSGPRATASASPSFRSTNGSATSIPFRPPEETADYLRELRAAGHELAVLADDGEKFGGWPGTKEWVYGRGLAGAVHRDDRRAGRARRGRCSAGSTRRSTRCRAAASPTCRPHPIGRWRAGPCHPTPPSGWAGWSAISARRAWRARTERCIRGSHWRNFLVKYPSRTGCTRR